MNQSLTAACIQNRAGPILEEHIADTMELVRDAAAAGAMVGAIRFRGPVTTRTTPASPTAPYSAVVDLDRGRE